VRCLAAAVTVLLGSSALAQEPAPASPPPSAPAPADPDATVSDAAVPGAGKAAPLPPAGKPHFDATPGLKPIGSDGAAPPNKDRNLFHRYLDMFDREMDYVGRADFWGAVTSHLPKGYLSVGYRFESVGAGGFFDGQGDRSGRLLDPLELDLGAAGGARLDFRAGGWARRHEIQVKYGILGNLDAFIDVPFIEMETWIDPVYQVRGATPRAVLGGSPDEFLGSLERLGRPRPKRRFSTGNVPELNDIAFGVSWNPYRNRYFSMSLAGRVTAPTGRVADPDGRLDLGLGPEIDRGSGSWMLGVSMGYDVRPPGWFDFLTFSFQVDLNQPLPQKRRLPGFLKPDDGYRSQVEAADPEVARYLDTYFPDLSGYAGASYTHLPGTSLGASAAANFDLYVVGLTIEYAYFAQMPSVLRDVPRPAMAVVGEARGVAGTTEHHLNVGIGTGALMGVYLPIVIKGGYDWMFGGVNSLWKDPGWNIGVNLYLPIAPPRRETDKDGRLIVKPRQACDPRW